MNATARESEPLNDLVEQVIGAAYEVANVLGPGFLEKVYERALVQELHLLGINAASQVPCPVLYKGHCVGDYLVDLLVDNQLVVELKCADHLANEHMAQVLNYLKATGNRLALLINFQNPKVQVKHIINSF
jgi:GxxExxY protein